MDRAQQTNAVEILGWLGLLMSLAVVPCNLVFGFGCVSATPFGLLGIIFSVIILARSAKAPNPVAARWLGGLGLAAGLLNLLVGIIGGLFFMDGSW